ncbi:hypothetical protein [Streptomyces albidoflavus]|uniref:hypothetical protein n=1 Tax=Streptomyces albidoflavus TaxID=1886 RepID=UPI0026BB07A0|nr:hypothetical protein [Streptomyces albidoflavus]
MDLPALLASASLLVPEETATENDPTVRDIWDLLVGDDWETALNLPEEPAADAGPPPATAPSASPPSGWRNCDTWSRARAPRSGSSP